MVFPNKACKYSYVRRICSRMYVVLCNVFVTKYVFIIGNHAVYNLQASCDENKKEWIKKLQAVFENLKLSS